MVVVAAATAAAAVVVVVAVATVAAAVVAAATVAAAAVVTAVAVVVWLRRWWRRSRPLLIRTTDPRGRGGSGLSSRYDLPLLWTRAVSCRFLGHSTSLAFLHRPTGYGRPSLFTEHPVLVDVVVEELPYGFPELYFLGGPCPPCKKFVLKLPDWTVGLAHQVWTFSSGKTPLAAPFSSVDRLDSPAGSRRYAHVAVERPPRTFPVDRPASSLGNSLLFYAVLLVVASLVALSVAVLAASEQSKAVRGELDSVDIRVAKDGGGGPGGLDGEGSAWQLPRRTGRPPW